LAGHVVQEEPSAKDPAPHEKLFKVCWHAALLVEHPSRCVPSPSPAALENTVKLHAGFEHVLHVCDAAPAGATHGVCVPVHGLDNVLLKHCVRAVEPWAEFGYAVGHAVHDDPLAKKLALHVNGPTVWVHAALLVAHPSRNVPSPVPAELENAV